MHRFLRELVALVPPADAPWPADARSRWVSAFAAVADLVYEDGVPDDDTPPGDGSADRPEEGDDAHRLVDLRDGLPAPRGRHARHRRVE